MVKTIYNLRQIKY